MIDANNNVKIIDFGLVIHNYRSSLSRESGTYPYMGPEAHLKGEDMSKFDIWSLGAVMYEMITGNRLITNFQRKTKIETRERLIELKSDLDKQLSLLGDNWLTDLISDMLEFYPENRPDIDTIIKALELETY